MNDRSTVFSAFLNSLEGVSFTTARSVEDQCKVEEMAKFVNALASWEVFATFTFAWNASVESARRCFERFVRSTLPNVSTFYSIELHPGGHGGHVHALFDRADFPRKAVWCQWKKRYGINRVEPIRRFSDVVDYCSKYVVKEHAWWNFVLSRAAYHRWQRVGEILFPLPTEKNFVGECDQLPLRDISERPKVEQANREQSA